MESSIKLSSFLTEHFYQHLKKTKKKIRTFQMHVLT